MTGVPVTDLCVYCGRPATGLAWINERRYCHDRELPSCYERALRVYWRTVGAA